MVVIDSDWQSFEVEPWAQEQAHWVLWIDAHFLSQQDSDLHERLLKAIQCRPNILLISGYDPYQDHHRKVHGEICQFIQAFHQVSSQGGP